MPAGARPGISARRAARLELAERLLLELKPSREVIAAVAEKHGITRRAARSDLEAVRAAWRERAATRPIGERLGWLIARLEEVRAVALATGDCSTALRAVVQLGQAVGAVSDVARVHVQADVTLTEAKDYLRRWVRRALTLIEEHVPDRVTRDRIVALLGDAVERAEEHRETTR